VANNSDFIVKNGLQVSANLVVGSYALSSSIFPIANGAIISGNVGIGTSTVGTGNVLAVNGKSTITGNIQIANTSTLSGILFSDGTFMATAPSSSTFASTTFTATGGQTVYTVNYTPGYIEVFFNGLKLSPSDYTASNGTSITLGLAAVPGDIVEVIAWSVVNLSQSSISNQTASNTYYPVFASGTGGQSLNINTNSLQLIPNSGNIITIGSVYAGNMAITNTTASTSSTTGALTVAGGVGVGGNLQVIGTSNLAGGQSTVASIITNTVEPVTVTATAPPGNVNIFLSNSSITFFTTAATANFNVNITYSNAATLNTVLSVGQAVTGTLLVVNGTTAYYSNVITVDGTRVGVSTYWLGNAAPTSGTVSGLDSYSYSVIKTASSTFTVLANKAQY